MEDFPMTETQLVVCDAGRGTLPKPECLKCALAGANTCGYDYSLLVYLLNDKERTGVHVTDLTGCLRMSYYRHTTRAAEYPHEILIRKLGTAVHAQLENDDPNFHSEKPLEAFGIVGTADVYYKNGRILDYKTTRWLKISNLPYGSHEKQVNIYAAMLREMSMDVTSAAIQYIDMSGPTKCKSCNQAYAPIGGQLQCPKCGNSRADAHLGAVTFEVPLHPQEEVVRQITERRDALLTALETLKAPTAEPSYLCSYCPYTSLCNEEN
jgi:CRISPR/Cas system-associated exonuclease Cas4 (RecB family)